MFVGGEVRPLPSGVETWMRCRALQVAARSGRSSAAYDLVFVRTDEAGHKTIGSRATQIGGEVRRPGSEIKKESEGGSPGAT